MKGLALQIEMFFYTDNKGNIKPIRSRMQIDEDPMQAVCPEGKHKKYTI